jgi:hypothetical protein
MQLGPQFRELITLPRSTNKAPSAEEGGSAGYQRIYQYSEYTGNTKRYTSLTEFKKQRLLKTDKGSLSGCIQRNGNLGKIELQPFSISIKGLDTDFDYQMVYSTEQWGQLIGFF